MTPRIAIPQPTSRDLAYNQRSWPAYASAITRSGGEPVLFELDLTPSDLRALAATCDGVLLPGSPADVDPALYGADRDPASAPADSAREAVDFFLLEDAARHHKPVLGICYGLQSLNVWHGGSLVQDLTPLPVNHEAGSSVAIAHTALIAPASILASLLTPEEATKSNDFIRLPINTSHHQAVATPGENLYVVARCPEDGVIEAVELQPQNKLFHVEQFSKSNPPDLEHAGWPIHARPLRMGGGRTHPDPKLFHVEQFIPTGGSRGLQPPETASTRSRALAPDRQEAPGDQIVPRGTIHPRFLLGVQWHPERSFDISPASRALFNRLVAEARTYAQSKATEAAPAL